MKGNEIQLLFGEKGEKLCQRLFSLHRRFPQLLSQDVFRELSLFLSNCSDDFLKNRDPFILSRILLSLFRFTNDVSHQRVRLKIFEISPSVYGISIAVFNFGEHEPFSRNYILKGMQNVIPGIKAVPNSFLFWRHAKAHLYYLEVKKMRGGSFSEDEKEKFYSQLSPLFQKGMDSSPLSLFFPGNEEEVFKNIRHLSRELKFVHDLPQVMISFVEYLQDSLKFLVIVLRIVKPKTPSIVSLSSQLPSLTHFSLENVFCLDRVRKKYPKEAAIFTLEVKTSLFVRNQNAVNLRTVRQYIVKALESMLGPFRDYNGGLLNKENEQLAAIKRVLDKKGIFFPLIEDFFYGIKPISMRSLVTTETGLKFVSLFEKIATLPLASHKKYESKAHSSAKVDFIIIKTKEKEWRNSLPQRMLAHSSRIGCSYFEYEEFLYLCFFHQYPEGDLLFKALEEELTHCTSFSSHQDSPILRINFQGGDPPSLNPRLANDIHCHILANLLFEGLTRVNVKGDIELAVAEKIDISANRLHYTFHLRPSFWSNGEEVTAYHFERAWKKALSVGRRMYMGFFYHIKNAKKASENSLPINQVGIKAKNTKTLSVELETSCPYFLNLTASPPFFPLFGDSEEPVDFNGPFTLAEWKRDSWIYLSKNPFYRDALHVKLSGIKILMLRDPSLVYQMFQKGELDLIGDPLSPLSPEVLKCSKIQKQLHRKNVSRIFWIHCNTSMFPLNNTFLRKALSLALDREQIIEKVFINQTPQISPLPPKYSSLEGTSEGDPEKARDFFEKALKQLKIPKNAFPALVYTHSDLSFEKPLIEELQKQWRRVLGISVISKQLPWNEFSACLERKNFQMGGLFRRDFYSHPMFYLGFFKSFPNNPHGWENTKYDWLIEECYREGKIAENSKKIEELLIDEVPVIPLISQKYLAIVGKRVKGIGWNENGCLDLKEARIDDKNL